MDTRDKGFTLIELLVVISIISMLSSLVLVALQGARDKGRIGGAILFEDNTYHALGANAVLRWTFDDVTTGGTSALDTSGNNLNGTINNVLARGVYPMTVTASGNGSSMFIDNTVAGNDDIIYNGGSRLLAITTGSVAAWIKASPVQAGNNYGAVVIAANISGVGYVDYGLFLYNPGSGYVLAVKNGDGSNSNNWIRNNSGPILNDDKWHYVAVSFAGGVTNGSHLYVDGNMTYTFTYNPPAASVEFNVGDGDPTGFYGYQGYIDNVAVYPSIITASEIQRLYAEGLKDHKLAER
jgi:prepilin-type N-terminal cleavage/methylation domain-containing protein